MSQSVIIFGVLIFLFIVFVTVKGQLPSYLAVLGLAPASNLPSAKKTSTGVVAGPLNLNLNAGG